MEQKKTEKRIYTFVEVPLIGYVLHEDSFTFGYKEYFSPQEYEVHAYLSKKEKFSELEQLMEKELTKGKMKAIAEGVGGIKGDLFLRSRMSSIFIALSMEEYTLFHTLIPLILVPGPVLPLLIPYFFKRLGENGAVEQLKKKLGEHVCEYDATPFYAKISELKLQEKIKEYAEAKKAGNLWTKLKRVWKLEPDLEAKRVEIAKGADELISTSKGLAMSSQGKMPYDITTQVYSVMRELYNYTWWQKGTPVVFGL